MYPVILQLEGQKVVVVGAGKVAYRKVCHLLLAGAKVDVVAPTLKPLFQSIQEDITWIGDHYKASYLEGAFLVIAATNDQAVNTAIGEACKAQGKLCNVADNKPLSSFIVPSVITKGDLIISVSTGGASPFLAKKIRDTIESQLDPDYEEQLNLLNEAREIIKKTVAEEPRKRALLYNLSEMSLPLLKQALHELKKDAQPKTSALDSI